VTINHIFLAFMGIVGAAVGIVLVIAPELRDFRVSPYFWVLIAMGVFELAAFARGRGAPGTVVTMDARLLGFVAAIVLMVAIPIVAGSPARLFCRQRAPHNQTTRLQIDEMFTKKWPRNCVESGHAHRDAAVRT
jgi:hypothetical protein